MRIAILVLCHKNPKQINLLLDSLKHPSMSFFVHVDKKSGISDSIIKRDDIEFLPDELRVDVQWARLSQVDAALNLLRYAKSKGQFDYFWLCSGQDFPIKPVDEIVRYLSSDRSMNYINLFSSKNWGQRIENKYDKRYSLYYPQWLMGRENWKRIVKRLYVEFTGGYCRTWWLRRKNTTGLDFYFGSQWWCLNDKTITWILKYFDKNPGYYRFLQNTTVPDESVFQTLFMNSPYASKRQEYLHYIDWSEGNSSPKLLIDEDYEKLMASPYLMARKFDIEVDDNLINRLYKELHPYDSSY